MHSSNHDDAAHTTSVVIVQLEESWLGSEMEHIHCNTNKKLATWASAVLWKRAAALGARGGETSCSCGNQREYADWKKEGLLRR